MSIEDYNRMMIEERKDLPNLLDMIAEYQEGSQEVFDMYFYGYKTMKREYYSGRKRSHAVAEVRFWDEHLSIFITNMKKRYCRNIKIGGSSAFSERNISFSTNVSNFEESEIDALWYEWMSEFAMNVKLENFQKESEARTLNALRLYIRKSFENHLKKVDNKRIGLERVRVDGELYYVKNNQEDVFFDDIYIGSDDDGNKMDFLDIIEHEDEYDVLEEEEFDYTSKHFIEENLEEVLTRKQYEKYKVLEEYVKEHGIESILDKHSHRIIKARVQRICYDGDFQNNERIDSLIRTMNKRMRKALDNQEIEYTPYEKPVAVEEEVKERRGSECITYTGGLTQEEVDEYFQRRLERIYDDYVSKRLTFVKGENGMLPSQDTLLEIPFDAYERFISSGKSIKLEIIEEYFNKEKFNLKAGPMKLIDKAYELEPEDKNARYVSVDEIREIRRKAGK